MARTIRAHFDGKQVKFDEPAELKAGTPLLVVVREEEAADGEADAFEKIVTIATSTGIPDLAENLDRYVGRKLPGNGA